MNRRVRCWPSARKPCWKECASWASHEGLFVAPEGAAVWMAARQLLATGWLRADERILLLNTGNGQKYMSNVAGRAAASAQ
ncbi:MAG: hypothetical protein WKG07_10195 [Hymenobacter sp.]